MNEGRKQKAKHKKQNTKNKKQKTKNKKQKTKKGNKKQEQNEKIQKNKKQKRETGKRGCLCKIKLNVEKTIQYSTQLTLCKIKYWKNALFAFHH